MAQNWLLEFPLIALAKATAPKFDTPEASVADVVLVATMVKVLLPSTIPSPESVISGLAPIVMIEGVLVTIVAKVGPAGTVALMDKSLPWTASPTPDTYVKTIPAP
jgi:hypothetical protein